MAKFSISKIISIIQLFFGFASKYKQIRDTEVMDKDVLFEADPLSFDPSDNNGKKDAIQGNTETNKAEK